jgi:hypothetical protein
MCGNTTFNNDAYSPPILDYTSPFRFSELRLRENFPINSKFGVMSERFKVKEGESAAVINWKGILHKNVRTKDYLPVGNIAQVTDSDILIMYQNGRNLYKVPKSYVQGFDGAEIFLDLLAGHIDRFKV